jgi:hypothetical protein
MSKENANTNPGIGSKSAVIPHAGNMRRVRLLSLALPIALLLLGLFGCPLYNPSAFVQHADEIASIANQLTLQWNPPTSGPTPVSYTLEYRIHGTTTWQFLATLPATSQPGYTIQHSVLGNGSFDFAVSATDSTGATSPLHTSLDQSADPTSGWFISWGQ